jgi:GGDEF domain-containing protein
MDLRIDHFDPFKEVYGFVAGDDVLRFTAMLIGEVIDETGSTEDFIGHPGGDNFIVITSEDKAPTILDQIRERFAEQVLTHYSFMDREQGFITPGGDDGKTRVPLMSVSIGSVSQSEHEFADIREITELAGEARRGNRQAED